MSDAWTRTKELTQRNAGGKFKRLQNDKEQMAVAVCGDPYGIETHWLTSTQDYAPCTGAGCEHCKEGTKKSSRVMLNVYVLEESAMKIFECSGKTFETVCDLRDNMDLTKWALLVTRHGAAKSTKTRYTVLPKRELTAEERATIAKTPLHDLAHADDEDEARPAPAPQAPSAPRDPDAKIPPDVVAEFRKRLSPLPVREKAYKPILAFFGCARLDEIRAADEHRARNLVDRAERGESIPPPPPKAGPTNELDEFS